MDLMHEHICNFTVFNHAYTQNDERNKHAWEHCRIALIKRVLADQIKEDAHGDQVFQI